MRAPGDRRLQRGYFALITLVGGAAAAWLVVTHGLAPLDLWCFLVMYAVTLVGMTVGYHRLLAHRSFEAHPALEAVLLACAGMSHQGRPSAFVHSHLTHHARADRPGDPHSPREGFWHAHMGWFVDEQIDPATLRQVRADPMVRFFDRTEWWWVAAGVVVPALVVGFIAGDAMGVVRGAVWGGLLRMVLAHHVLWAGASLCHRFGTRAFATADDSRNNLLVVLLQLGEGWHNNHHAAPWAANHRDRPWQIDPQATLIRAFERLGWARDVRWAGPGDWAAVRARHGGAPTAVPARPDPARMKARSPAFRLASVLVVIVVPLVGLFFGARSLWRGQVTGLDLSLLAGMYVASYLGLTLGYHRMLSHRAFAAHPAVRALFYALGGMGAMAEPSAFAAAHRVHHAHADGPGDPHSPREGLWYAHYGWILSSRYLELGRECARLQRDPMVRFFDRTHVLWALLGLLLPFVLGGLIGGGWRAACGGLVWGGAVRLFVMQQALFATASLNHHVGRRAFATPDGSRNSPFLLNVLQLGDGYHNNHHALPWSATFNTHRGQLDLPGLVVRALAALHLVQHARCARPEDWRRRARQLGDVEA